ncbi:MAG: carbohydrate ABC transporter permease [Nitrososphaeria archaeon]|nr:carbohydrate ABC transporter permease [Nitrososphaeria archaeon]
MTASRKISVRTVILYFLIAMILAIAIFPILWMGLTAFKREADVLSIPPKMVFAPTFENFEYVFERSNIVKGLINSLIALVAVIAITIPVGLFGAYSLARFNIGGGHLAFYILTIKMFPPIAAIIPYFVIFRNLGLLDNLVSVILLNSLFNLPFTIWILMSFIRELPADLEEAAMVAGATRFEAFREILLPLLRPAIAVTAIFTGIFTWNEFLFAFILTRTEAITITRVMAGFYTERGILWGPLSAAALIATVPMFILALLTQKYIIRGLTFGAVK